MRDTKHRQRNSSKTENRRESTEKTGDEPDNYREAPEKSE